MRYKINQSKLTHSISFIIRKLMLFNRTLGLDILQSERETQESMVSYQQPLLYLLNLNLLFNYIFFNWLFLQIMLLAFLLIS